ncbi:hypothetical protein [Sodalis praecaptivus]|uniref:hypothetical protein n=1 Tax=Sodalis praecaptivus TaxID=1239307 RepID=UPI0031F90E2E
MMRRIDDLAGDLLSEIWRISGNQKAEQVELNRKWIIRIRKQIDMHKILSQRRNTVEIAPLRTDTDFDIPNQNCAGHSEDISIQPKQPYIIKNGSQ